MERILWQARKEGRFGRTIHDNTPREGPFVLTPGDPADLAMAQEPEAVSMCEAHAENIDTLPTSPALTCVEMADAAFDRPHVMGGVTDGEDDLVGEGMEVEEC